MDLTLVDPMDPALLVLVERALIVEDLQDLTGRRMACSGYKQNNIDNIALKLHLD